MDLPADLHDAVGSLSGRACRPIDAATRELSRRYRAEHGRPEGALLRAEDDPRTYALYRLPATYAAVRAVLGEVRVRRHAWQPRSLIDAGSGPGTAAWAAVKVWPGIERITLLERDRRMVVLGRDLMSQAQHDILRQAEWELVDLTAPLSLPKADLVVAAYMLGEVQEAERQDVVARLWEACSDTLVIVEPGTPGGFSLVREARDRLRARGAFTAAPCPHNDACPIAAGDWCHFAQRLSRPRFQREAKRAALPYEDEKFSYAVLCRDSVEPVPGRVIRHPQVRKGHVYLDLCMPDGIERRIVSRRDAEAYREAKSLRWGSALSNPPSVERAGASGQGDEPSYRKSV